MSALTISLSTWCVALALGVSEGPRSGTRSILREKVDARGVVGAELAAQTGWSVARGFLWQILLPDAEGRFRPARPDQVFRTGQAFRLCIEPQCDLWVYLLNRDPEGHEVVLLPERGEEHLLVRQGQKTIIPADGQFRFTDPPGVEAFRVLASPAKLDWVNPRELFALQGGEPVDDRARGRAEAQKQARTRAIADLQQGQARRRVVTEALGDVVGKLAADPGLRRRFKDTVVVEPPREDAQLVIQASADPAERDPIVFDIRLQHRHP